MASIECVPNISEGRRPRIVDAIATAVRQVRGVRVLDVASDVAHNRTVLTFAGDTLAVQQAVLALFEAAVPVIDLRAHHGEHPRMGAVDVVPFVPIGDTAMDTCVTLARETAAEVARRFQIPVFLYEEAATSPARRNLADIRRGEFEGLQEKLSRPEWQPDFGPDAPHPSAGATAVGARMPLVAFNVNLDTNRLDIAKAIARAVRHSSGGLPFVKALGVTLADRGLVQVSMNLTNYRETPIARAFDAVRAEAERHGVRVLESEIIGLVPAAALAGVDLARLRLTRFSDNQVLERKLGLESSP